MKIRHVKPKDVERIHSLFQSAALTRDTIAQGNAPNSGFFEYNLTLEDIRELIEHSPLSQIMEDGSSIVGYIIAGSVRSLEELADKDEVLARVSQFPKDVTYIDQFFLQPGYPAFLAGRLFDTWEHMVRGERLQGALAFIPQRPWTNKSSTRLALHRGFRREESVKADGIRYGLFTKPYIEVGENFRA